MMLWNKRDSMRDLSGITVFAAVVEEGSFTAAGQRLGQSKSLISK
jgi:DNA-binding transcriptional LysR family regulator